MCTFLGFILKFWVQPKVFFLKKSLFFSLVLSLPLLACMWEREGAKCHRVRPEMARRDALATHWCPESAVFLVKEEEGIVRKYKTSPKKKINQRAQQTAFDFDDCRAINISRWYDGMNSRRGKALGFCPSRLRHTSRRGSSNLPARFHRMAPPTVKPYSNGILSGLAKHTAKAFTAPIKCQVVANWFKTAPSERVWFLSGLSNLSAFHRRWFTLQTRSHTWNIFPL